MPDLELDRLARHPETAQPGEVRALVAEVRRCGDATRRLRAGLADLEVVLVASERERGRLRAVAAAARALLPELDEDIGPWRPRVQALRAALAALEAPEGRTAQAARTPEE